MSEKKTTAEDWGHLKSYGYAPGNYTNKCYRCLTVVECVDKRAISCRPCAEALHAVSSTKTTVATP